MNTTLKIPSVMKWQVWKLVSWNTRILGHNILPFCRHCTTLGSNGFWGQAALSSELFVCCNVRTISAVKTLRITGGRRNAVSNWVCGMKGQFVYTQLCFFFLLGIRISKSWEAARFLLRVFWTVSAQQKLFCPDAWYTGLRRKETSLGFLLKHESQFDLVFAFPVAIFTNYSKESAHSYEMYASTLFLPL